MPETPVRRILGSIEGEFRRSEALGRNAIAQLSDAQVHEEHGSTGNTITTLVWHVAGNLESRFTDFLRSDGEKVGRDRESEFVKRVVARADLTAKWDKGWSVLFAALAALDDRQLEASVSIRGVTLSVLEALHRSLCHVSYHVGQIVFLAKSLRGEKWDYLSIPPGGSEAYNRNPVREKPPA
jgi:uncharacterized damage-inducible protein DinB